MCLSLLPALSVQVLDIDFDDVGTDQGVMRVTVSCSHGTLKLQRGSELVTTAATPATAVTTAAVVRSFTLAGSLTEVNAALTGLVYKPDADWHGTDTVIVVANDGGCCGTGGALQDVQSIQVLVSPVPDPPVIHAPPYPIAATKGAVSDVAGSSVTSADGDNEIITVQISVARGSVSLSSIPAGVTATGG
jgi:hypothetical protein